MSDAPAAALPADEAAHAGGDAPAASPARGAAHAEWFAPALTLVYAGALLFVMMHHEMWRDETRAWMIARHSENLLELWKLGKYEGAPMLWSALLRPLTWISVSPLMMQAAHFVIAAAVVFVVAKYAPFTRLQKILFPFGYFPLYEYGAITRNYALAFLLVALLCVWLPHRHRHPLRIGVVLLLLSQTSAHALMVAAGITLGLIWEYWLRRPPKDAIDFRGCCAAFALAAFGIAAAVLQILPSGDVPLYVNRFGTSFENYRLPFDWAHLAEAVRAIGKALFPAPEYTMRYWGSYLLDLPWSASIAIALGIAVYHRRYPIALMMCFCAGAGLLVIFYALHHGFSRHYGFFFMLLIFLLWGGKNFARDAAPRQTALCTALERMQNRPGAMLRAAHNLLQKHFGAALFTALLMFHAFGGALAGALEYRHTFSSGKLAAQFIRDSNLTELPLIGHHDNTARTVLAYLPEKHALHFLAGDEYGDSYGNLLVFSPERRKSFVDLHAQTTEIARNGGGKALLVLNYRLNAQTARRGYTLLTSFTKVMGDEISHIYLFQPK